MIRNRADARWLPSRFRFAPFRLIAYFRLRHMPPRHEEGLVLAIDRDQAGTDHYVFSAILAIVTISYVTAGLMLVAPAAVAIPIAVLITGFLAQIPMYTLSISLTLAGRLFGMEDRNHLRIQDAGLLTMLVASACWAAVSHSWLRFIGRGFLLAVAVNLLAALLAFALRKPMAELEHRFTVEQQ